MSQKAVLAGGSGLLGHALAHRLAARGWEVVMLTRDPDVGFGALAPAETGTVRLVYWDGQHGGKWTAELEGAEALVNLAGRSINCVFTLDHSREILESRLNAVQALGKAVAKCQRAPAVWVQAGAVGYYGNTGDGPCDESTPPGRDFLAEICRQGEEAFRLACPAEVRPVVLRFGVVLDRKGGALPPLVRLTRRCLGGRAGPGTQGFSWVHTDDASQAMQQAIVRPDLTGAYNVCAPRPVTNATLMKTLRRMLHRPWSPPAPGWIVGPVATRLMKVDPSLVLGGRRCLPQRLLAQRFRFEFPDLETALTDLTRP